MPEYAADDATFIAQRLKEIEAEKKAAREKPSEDDGPKTTTENTPTNATNISDDGWMGY